MARLCLVSKVSMRDKLAVVGSGGGGGGGVADAGLYLPRLRMRWIYCKKWQVS